LFASVANAFVKACKQKITEPKAGDFVDGPPPTAISGANPRDLNKIPAHITGGDFLFY